jgi:hypothetical protein
MAESDRKFSRLIRDDNGSERVVSIRGIRGDEHPEHEYPGWLNLSLASSSDFGIELTTQRLEHPNPQVLFLNGGINPFWAMQFKRIFLDETGTTSLFVPSDTDRRSVLSVQTFEERGIVLHIATSEKDKTPSVDFVMHAGGKGSTYGVALRNAMEEYAAMHQQT